MLAVRENGRSLVASVRRRGLWDRPRAQQNFHLISPNSISRRKANLVCLGPGTIVGTTICERSRQAWDDHPPTGGYVDTWLALDFLLERVLIWNYVYTI